MSQAVCHSATSVRNPPIAVGATIIGLHDRLLPDLLEGAGMDTARAIEVPKGLIAVREGAPVHHALLDLLAPPTPETDAIAA
jgi:hypothetical protein